jgi:glycosyltransferase involved in cell wall biosynthesis
MMSQPPLVSVGVPVYNGERTLPAALDSLLAQDYPNLEFVLCDNASADATPRICEQYAARDRRIRYERNPANLGAIANFNLTFERSRGEFFAWAAHDDLRAPTYFSRCVEALVARPEAVLAHCRAIYVDEQGHPSYDTPINPLDEHASPRQRFHAAMIDPWWGLAVYGLMRTSAMRKTGLIRDVLGGDKVFLAELSLLGAVVEIPERLWSYHMKPFDRRYLAALKRALLVERRISTNLFPYVTVCAEYMRIAARAPVAPVERVALAVEALRWYGINVVVWPAGQAAAQALLGAARYDRLRARLQASRWFRRLRHLPEQD